MYVKLKNQMGPLFPTSRPTEFRTAVKLATDVLIRGREEATLKMVGSEVCKECDRLEF